MELKYRPAAHGCCSELSDHVRELELFLGQQPFQPGMSVIERMKTALKYSAELLSAEDIAGTLNEVNRKISVSIQRFMVSLYFADGLEP